MGPCPGRQVAVAAVLLTILVSSVRADSLDEARKAVEGSDYLMARPALEAALKAGKAGPEDLAEIHMLTGIVEAALGNEEPAQRAFGKWLALDPKGSLPMGTSPKIMRPFEAAHANATKRGALEAKAESADDPPAITLVVVNDPMQMIVGAKVHFIADKKPEETLSADGNKRVTIELGTGKRIDVRLHAVDVYGNRVVELGSKDVPIVITSSGKETKIDPGDARLVSSKLRAEPDRPRPWYLQWWLWGSVTVVATGAGGYFAWQTRSDLQELDRLNANSLSHRWSEAQAVEDSARRNLLVTNIAAGAAGAFAIGTILLYVTRPDTSGTELRATIAPAREGGAVVLGGRF